MSIRKQIISENGILKGFLDYGGLLEVPEESKTVEAKNAMFVMATEINGSHKIPLAYLLTNSLDGVEIKNMIYSVLKKMDECGAKVLSITCDGLKANLSALTQMGAKLEPKSKQYQSFIMHPVTYEKVFILPDPIHMIKLLRNALKAYEFFFDKSEKVNYF
jgi:hypothetical protein